MCTVTREDAVAFSVYMRNVNKGRAFFFLACFVNLINLTEGGALTGGETMT